MHQTASVVLGVFVAVVGLLHFAASARVQALVPDWWPAPRLTVYVSGAVEVALGVALCFPAARLPVGLVVAAMLVAYVGVHADAFRHVRTATTFMDSVPGVIVRVLVNVVYVAWALYVALGG